MKIYQSTRDIYKDHQKEGLKKKRTKNTQYAQEDPIQSIKSNNGNEPSLIYKPTQAKRLQRKESFNSWSTYIHWLIERLYVLTKCFLVWIFFYLAEYRRFTRAFVNHFLFWSVVNIFSCIKFYVESFFVFFKACFKQCILGFFFCLVVGFWAILSSYIYPVPCTRS